MPHTLTRRYKHNQVSLQEGQVGNMQLSQSDPNEQVELLIQKYGDSPWVKSIVACLPW